TALSRFFSLVTHMYGIFTALSRFFSLVTHMYGIFTVDLKKQPSPKRKLLQQPITHVDHDNPPAEPAVSYLHLVW
ncbi:hypothetical protein, partial [Paenibacillus sp.]|uniref:hypothetical protein n=1 Tax=Paenibacillus sp. TaxID=58172 RepID=UPI0028B07AD7